MLRFVGRRFFPVVAEFGQRSRAFWEERAEAIDPEVRDFVALSMLRQVQAIVAHLEHRLLDRTEQRAKRLPCAA